MSSPASQTVRGAVTEGRYLVLESKGYALNYAMLALRTKRFLSSVTADKAMPAHNKACVPIPSVVNPNELNENRVLSARS